MTPYDDFVTWFNETPGAAQFTRARGMWVDDPASAAKRFAVFQFQGGRDVDPDLVAPTIDVLLLGPQKGRTVAGVLPALEDFAYTLVARSKQNSCSGRITGIRALGLVVGPGFTTEDRPWYRISFELTGVALSG